MSGTFLPSHPGELLIWLSLTDIEELSDEPLREVVLGALEPVEEEAGPWEALLENASDLFDQDLLDREAIACWPQRYGYLVPNLVEAEELVVEWKNAAGRLSGEECSGPRLDLFFRLLLGLGESLDSPEREESQRLLQLLEDDLCQSWNQYVATPLVDYSGRSLAAHQLLAEAYEAWGQAIDLARDGDSEQALGEALRGSRLLTALVQLTTSQAA